MNDSPYDKACNGDYRSKLPLPSAPRKPKLLCKRVGDMTLEEFDAASAMTRAYSEASEAAKQIRYAYTEDQNRLIVQMRADLETYHGTVGHRKADKLWEMAWDNGHAYGDVNICNEYAILSELVV